MMKGNLLSNGNYEEIFRWLLRLHKFGSKPGLENISHLLALLADPQKDFRSIHVTGTNGKGSTVAMISSILSSAGYNVGMFTSPQLSSFTERIQINGKQIPPKEIIRILEEIRPLAEGMEKDPAYEGLRHPTFFEVVTALGVKYFSDKSVDFAVLEVGMGGRLDATNVVHSLVSVLTNVSLEHTEVLGDTVLEIAEEKAGIVKQGGVLVTATEDEEVFNLLEKICESKDSKIYLVDRDVQYKKFDSSLNGQRFRIEGLNQVYEELFIPLLGSHQIRNAATAVGAVESLSHYGIEIQGGAIKKGLKDTTWPGRLEVVQKNPLVVLDCAKDVKAVKAVKEALLDDFSYDKVMGVVSISSDKKIPEMMREMGEVVDHFIITTHKVRGRAAEPYRLVEEAERNSKTHEVVLDVKDAVERGIRLAKRGDMVLVIGSVFFVGEARKLWYKPEYPDPI
jgi:dihydrofolate synthase/folylpolyglutamate synthase